MVLNSCLLFVVLFYVYPLKFISKGIALHVFGVGTGQTGYGISDLGELASLFTIYGIAFAAVFLCFSLLYLHAFRLSSALARLSHRYTLSAFYDALRVFAVRFSAVHQVLSGHAGSQTPCQGARNQPEPVGPCEAAEVGGQNSTGEVGLSRVVDGHLEQSR